MHHQELVSQLCAVCHSHSYLSVEIPDDILSVTFFCSRGREFSDLRSSSTSTTVSAKIKHSVSRQLTGMEVACTE
jgi:hypothetical protein